MCSGEVKERIYAFLSVLYPNTQWDVAVRWDKTAKVFTAKIGVRYAGFFDQISFPHRIAEDHLEFCKLIRETVQTLPDGYLKGEKEMEKTYSTTYDLDLATAKNAAEDEAAQQIRDIQAEKERKILEAKEACEREKELAEIKHTAEKFWAYYSELKACGFSDDQAMMIILDSRNK